MRNDFNEWTEQTHQFQTAVEVFAILATYSI